MTVEEYYTFWCKNSVDIGEHLPHLREMAEKCETIVEFGVFKGASSSAFLAGTKGFVYSYDIEMQPEIPALLEAAGGNWIFRLASSLTATIPWCDMLFIDSWHTGDQLTQELGHYAKVRKWIVMHDTETFGTRGEEGGTGLWGALQTWLAIHPEWRIKEHLTNNNGLTVLERT